jgi:hypothetical protein
MTPIQAARGRTVTAKASGKPEMFRTTCLDRWLFSSITEARVVINHWLEQSLAGGIQHDQAAWLAGWHELKVLFTALDVRKYQSTTGNPNSVSGPKILGLPERLLKS